MVIEAVGQKFDRSWFEAKCAEFTAALTPCPAQWLGDRLSVLLMAMGHTKSSDVATAWMYQNMRLLADIPADILVGALDDAVKAPVESSLRGFPPSIALIRSFADPAIRQRQVILARLKRIVAAFDGADDDEVRAEIGRRGPGKIGDYISAVGTTCTSTPTGNHGRAR